MTSCKHCSVASIIALVLLAVAAVQAADTMCPYADVAGTAACTWTADDKTTCYNVSTIVHMPGQATPGKCTTSTARAVMEAIYKSTDLKSSTVIESCIKTTLNGASCDATVPAFLLSSQTLDASLLQSKLSTPVDSLNKAGTYGAVRVEVNKCDKALSFAQALAFLFTTIGTAVLVVVIVVPVLLILSIILCCCCCSCCCCYYCCRERPPLAQPVFMPGGYPGLETPPPPQQTVVTSSAGDKGSEAPPKPSNSGSETPPPPAQTVAMPAGFEIHPNYRIPRITAPWSITGMKQFTNAREHILNNTYNIMRGRKF